MPVTVYKSSDASAPVLNNTAGSLVAVLDACLVTGFGAKAGAGWTKAFTSGTTGASYKQGAGSNGFYLNIDDAQPNTARARGFETMTAYNTGPIMFPIDGQQSGGPFVQKTNNAVANQIWVVVANAKTFYFFSSWDANAAATNGTAFFFGDFPSEKAGDPYSTMIMGAMSATQTTDASNAPTTTYMPYHAFCDLVMGGHYAVRSHTGLGGSAPIGKHINFARLGWNTNGNWLSSYRMCGGNGTTGIQYPSPPNGGIYLSPIWIHEDKVVRGRLPGIYVLQTASARPAHLDTYTGSGDMAGKTFICVNMLYNQFHIETSDTW